MNSQRALFLFAALACAALIGIALYFQYVMYLDPCPLCILQRIVIITMAAVFVLALIHNPRRPGRVVYGLVTTVLGLTGGALAARHVWLQNLPPDQVPECGPGLDYIVDNFPLTRALELVLTGSGECAEVQWTFLGLSISGWTLVCFATFTLFGLYLLLRRVPTA